MMLRWRGWLWQALEGAVDRWDAGVQQAGDVAGGPGQHVAEDERSALSGGQELERGEEGQPPGLAVPAGG